MEAIVETGAEETLTANPGCMLQLQQGLAAAGHDVAVRHVVDILDEAYRQEDRTPTRADRVASQRSQGRGTGPLQMNLDEARASQMAGSRRRGPFGRQPDSNRRRPRNHQS